jgi:hypothetical protein
LVSTVFTKFKNNFSTYFPIPGRAARLTGIGQTMDLRPKSLGVSLYFPVKVTKMHAGATSAGWTFGTRPGHPDYPGFITFKMYRSGVDLHLSIHGNIPALTWASPIVKAAYYKKAQSTWQPLYNSMWHLVSSYR